MELHALEQNLEKARADLAQAQEATSAPGECFQSRLQILARLTDELRVAERALYAARGEEHAGIWEGVPRLHHGKLPRVFQRKNNRVTVLAVLSYVPSDWTGKVVGEISYTDESPTLRIDFKDARVRWSKPGSLDIERHPLLGRGLDPYQALRVVNSRWTGPGTHHLMIFDTLSLEVLGTPTALEVWAVTIDEAAFGCDGRPLTPDP